MEEWGSIADWTGAIAQVAASIGTGWVIWQTRKTIDISERAERLQVFMDFAKEYDRVRALIPNEILAKGLVKGKVAPSVARALTDLIKLFEREHFLHRAGLVDGQIWKMWEKAMKKYFAKPGFKSAWALRDKERLSHEFENWVELTLKGTK